ncbi:hypothetical protein [Cytobacillus praedii]|uniref:hypothetical protein n=1 Tax=Cytobacillus praedii TaxID=1742358 RepID=UPI003AF4AB04
MFEVGLISFLLAAGLSLPFPLFFGFLGHHFSSCVTVSPLFLSPRASLRRFRYRYLSFSLSSGIIAVLSLPLPLFFALLGHHCGAFVTVTSLFRSPRATLRGFRYRLHSFSLSSATLRGFRYRYLSSFASSGIIAGLSLPSPLFFALLGHHCGAFVTVTSLFRSPRASLRGLGYRLLSFWAFSGIIAGPWLPSVLFLGFLGHHCGAFVTVSSLFHSPRASLRGLSYRLLSFLAFSGIISALSLPFPLFFALLGHHCGAFVTVTSLFRSPRATLRGFRYRLHSFSLSSATLRGFRYRLHSFSLSSGIIAGPWLPSALFFGFLGHHCGPFVTVSPLFLLIQASLPRFRYLPHSFSPSSSIIAAPSLPSALFFSFLMQHCGS